MQFLFVSTDTAVWLIVYPEVSGLQYMLPKVNSRA
jgi:hypothetical protein